MRYSLAKVIVSITLPDDFDKSFVNAFGSTLSIGGSGSFVGSIKCNYNSELFTTEGDATGGHVHIQNLDRTGNCIISIKQVADTVQKFIRLCNCFFKSQLESEEGLYIEVKDLAGNLLATCKDCYIKQIPEQGFEATPAMQDWPFTVGVLHINPQV